MIITCQRRIPSQILPLKKTFKIFFPHQIRIFSTQNPNNPNEKGNEAQNPKKDSPSFLSSLQAKGRKSNSGEEIKKNKTLLDKYLSLSKARLSSLVCVTAAGGYMMANGPILTSYLLITCIGTSLAIASANAINQYIEVDCDILMRRTAGRVLPTGELSLNHALAFGIVTGIIGTCTLAFFVNGVAAGLALGNILLYTLVYTPLKRKHWINTWVGSVVGAIPPLIGWAANTGGLELGAWVLFYTMFIWQIPHFFALSWPLQHDYGRAGYKMLVNTHPEKVPWLTFKYCLYLLPIAPLAFFANLVTPYFMISCTILNIWMIYKANDFRIKKTNVEARKCFMATLFYLPLLIMLFVIHKLNDEDDKEKWLEQKEQEVE